uniref:DUF1618 domain-containing protein n=1 Tax=Leersia perrieri TaxID=77586 RepID=A0A0D9W0E7_9ORYZ
MAQTSMGCGAPSYVVLDRCVDIQEERDDVESSEWKMLECKDRKTYLSEKDAKPTMVADALALLVRCVHSVGDDLIVFTADLSDGSECYLVYDAIDKPLTMIPYLPNSCTPFATIQPLPVRGGGGYSLALLGRDERIDRQLRKRYKQHAVCLCPPPPSSIPPPDYSCSYNSTPWGFKKALFPPDDMPDFFDAHAVFTSKSGSIWADLLKGALVCTTDDIISGGSDVPFRYIPLPPECQFGVGVKKWHLIKSQLKLCRTMSCCGDSIIKFVSIDIDVDGSVPPNKTMVKVWTLNLATQQWHKDWEFSVASLWEMEGFNKAGLPRSKPINPIITMEQQVDVLYFMLTSYAFPLEEDDESGAPFSFSFSAAAKKEREVYMVSLNMNTKTILSSTRLPSYPFMPPLGFLPANLCRPAPGEVFPVPPKRINHGDLDPVCPTASFLGYVFNFDWMCLPFYICLLRIWCDLILSV